MSAEFKLGKIKYGDEEYISLIEFQNTDTGVKGVVASTKNENNDKPYYAIFSCNFDKYHAYNWITPEIMSFMKQLPEDPNKAEDTVKKIIGGYYD